MTKPHIVGDLLSPPAGGSLSLDEKSILTAHYPYILYRWGDMVIPAGFEPSITSLKGSRPDLLVEGTI